MDVLQYILSATVESLVFFFSSGEKKCLLMSSTSYDVIEFQVLLHNSNNYFIEPVDSEIDNELDWSIYDQWVI